MLIWFQRGRSRLAGCGEARCVRWEFWNRCPSLIVHRKSIYLDKYSYYAYPLILPQVRPQIHKYMNMNICNHTWWCQARHRPEILEPEHTETFKQEIHMIWNKKPFGYGYLEKNTGDVLIIAILNLRPGISSWYKWIPCRLTFTLSRVYKTSKWIWHAHPCMCNDHCSIHYDGLRTKNV